MDPPTPSSSATLHGGTRIDRYEVLDLLGAGGFGAVYRARHVHTQEIVALKVLRSAARSHASAWEGLLKEARITSQIGHPNIVRVLDAGVAEGGTPFLVTEFANGLDLVGLLSRERSALIPARAVDLVVQVLAALEAAHACGVIHRDVKPANIVVSEARDAAGATREIARILDFGISKLRESDWAKTQPGMSMGTPGFVAPEQFADAASVDARADIYGAGATLYFLLAGHLPFRGSTPEALMSATLTEHPIPLASAARNVPPALARVVDIAIARDPAQRWRTAAEFAQALLGALHASHVERLATGNAATVALDVSVLGNAPTTHSPLLAFGTAPTTAAPVSTPPRRYAVDPSSPSPTASPFAPGTLAHAPAVAPISPLAPGPPARRHPPRVALFSSLAAVALAGVYGGVAHFAELWPFEPGEVPQVATLPPAVPPASSMPAPMVPVAPAAPTTQPSSDMADMREAMQMWAAMGNMPGVPGPGGELGRAPGVVVRQLSSATDSSVVRPVFAATAIRLRACAGPAATSVTFSAAGDGASTVFFPMANSGDPSVGCILSTLQAGFRSAPSAGAVSMMFRVDLDPR
ncbi:MAG: protein kinase [Deltaproteobacteria bacterium]